MTPTVRNLSIGGTSVAILIYFGSVLGVNYQGAILNHLADVVNGPTTNVVVSNNAPNWGIGVPVATPQIGTLATSSYGSAASGLASSTAYTFAIAAVDGYGTTTLSSPLTMTTDAKTTQPNPEVINLTWSAVNGATGYVIWFATSSNATTFSQYFFATSSQNYAFSTSTGSLAGSYTKTDTTAFEEMFAPNGPDWVEDNVGTATNTPAASSTALQVNGNLTPIASATTTSCYAGTNGAIFYNTSNSHLWLCVGSAGPTWTLIK